MIQQNNFDFSQPNKLEKKALWLVLGSAFWVIIRAFWPMMAIFAIKGIDKVPYWFYLIFLGVLILTFIRLYINYQFFNYQIIDDELIINKGWLSKSKTVVKLDKIHEVNLSQKFLHKIIGLYFLTIDTAGSSKTEIKIDGISYQKALAFKKAVLTNDSKMSDVEIENLDDVISENNSYSNINTNSCQNLTNKIKISFSSLFKIGLTRNYLQTLGLLFAFSYQIIEQIQDFFYNEDEDLIDDIVAFNVYEEFGLLIGLMIFFGFILFIVLFNLVRTIITYYNYQIDLNEEKLTVSYGLTDSHIISIPSNRVQLFQIQQNYLQKLMNLFEVKIKQIESEDNSKKRKGLIVPGANLIELEKIFKVIYKDNIERNNITYKQNKRIILIRFFKLLISFSFAVIAFIYGDVMEFIWVLPVLFCVFLVFVWLSYKNQKLQFDNDFIILKSGVWDVTTSYLQVNKIQQVAIKQSYFQHKRNVGTLVLETAAGSLDLYYYEFSLLQNLANMIVYKIEKDKLKWM